MSLNVRHCIGASIVTFAPSLSLAHSYSVAYLPPIPLWMYAYGCAATVLASFGLVAYFARDPETFVSSIGKRDTPPVSICAFPPAALQFLRVAATGALLLTIISGLVGTPHPAQNIASPLFWVFYLLGFAYITSFAGNIYELINPLKWAADGLERMQVFNPPLNYPKVLSYWPAFIGYAGVLWLELFHTPRPFMLALTLLGYSGLMLLGAALFGSASWFKHADPFSVYFSLFSKLAPIKYEWRSDMRAWQIKIRRPLSAAAIEHPERLVTVLFVLLLLSSTTYDAIHETARWIGLYWRNFLQLLRPLYGDDLGKAQSMLMGGYLVYQQIGLLLFPIIYLMVYLMLLWLTRVITPHRFNLMELAKEFCYSLLPIAIAYHFAHYCLLLFSEVRMFILALANPLDWEWNPIKLPDEAGTQPLPMSTVWHIQISAILLGHIASVMLAHQIAQRRFTNQRSVLLSQLPLLAIMLLYTVFGLWILSLPLGHV